MCSFQTKIPERIVRKNLIFFSGSCYDVVIWDTNSTNIFVKRDIFDF